MDEVFDAASEPVADDVTRIVGIRSHAAAKLQRQNDVDVFRISWSFTDSLAGTTVVSDRVIGV